MLELNTLQSIQYGLIFIGLLSSAVISFKSVMRFLYSKENTKLIKKFEHFHAILTYHMEAAFDTIHKDSILVYSLDGVKPTEKDIDYLSHEHVKLTLRLAGPNMIDLFLKLYGGEDTFYFIIMDYFNRRFEDDEVRASAIESYQDEDQI